jgi:hypothetical protein
LPGPLIAVVSALSGLLVGSVLIWVQRWRVVHDWRYSRVPWRKRRSLR